jgi:hypothetical protein
MRAVLRLLVCLLTSAALVAAVIPAQAAPSPVGEAGCCAKLKMEAQQNDCGGHAPKSDQEEDCCAVCVPCAVILSPATRPFVYPPTGEESFATLSIREHVRSYRPPVPPPRA